MIDVIMIGPFPEDPAFIKGGVQASVYGLSRALLQKTEIHSLTVIALPVQASKAPVKSETIENIEVTQLNAPYRFQSSVIMHLPRIMHHIHKRKNPVVHIHGTGLFQCALLSWLRLHGIPSIWTLHGITEKETLQRYREQKSFAAWGRYLFYRILERLSLRIARHIIVDTPYVRDAIISEKRVHVIPQGIFIDEFSKRSTQDPNLILSLGVFDPRKGHHLTLQAFATLKDSLPQARLIIAGAMTIPTYLQSLQSLADTLGIADRVQFAANLPRRDIIGLLLKAWVFALHSQEESQGIALCEAMAAGLPIVATNVGGIPFIVRDKQDGLLASYGDIDTFAKSISSLLTNETLRTELSGHARLSAQRFDWQSVAIAVLTLYRQAERKISAPAGSSAVQHNER